MSNPTNNEAQPSAKEKALQVMAEMYDNKDSQSSRPSVRDRVNEVLDSMSPSRGVLESDKEYGLSGYRTMIPADKDIIEDGVIVAKKGDMVPKYPGLMALESDLVRDLHARQAEDVQPTEEQKKAIAPDIKSQWKNKSLETQVAENAPATALAPKIEKPIPFERELANLRSNINQSIYRVNQSIKKEKESRFAKGQGPTLEGLKETSYRESARRTLLSVAKKIDNYNYDSVDEAGRGIVSFIDGMAESLWGAVKSTATLGLYDLKDTQNKRRVARSMQEGEDETSKETQGDIDITSVGSIIDNELKELSDGQKELYKAMLLEYSVNSLLEGKERWSRSTGEMTGEFLAFMGELAIGMGFIKAAGKTALMQSLKSGVNTMLTKAQWDVMRKMMGVSSKVTRSALKFGTTKAGKALRYVGKSAVMDAPEMTLALAPWTGLDIAEAQKPYFMENGKLTMPRGKEAVDNALNTLAMSYISNFGLKLGQGVQAEVTKNFADANKYIFQKLTQGKDIVPLSAEVIFRAGKAINNNVLSHTSLATMDFTSKAIGEMLNIAPGGITDYDTEEAVKVLVASIISGKAISLSSRLMTPREKSHHQQQMRQATLMVRDMVLRMNPDITSEQLNTILDTYQRGVQSMPQTDGKVTGVLKVYNTLLKIANNEVRLEKVRYEAEKADLTKRRADLLNSKYYQSRPKELNDALGEINQELRNIQDAHIRHLNRVAEDISFIIHVKSNDYAMRYGVYELPVIEGKAEQGLQYVSPLQTEGPRSGFSTSVGLLGPEDVNIYLPSVDRTKSKVNDVAIAQLGDLVSVHIDNAPDTFNRDAVVGILQEAMAYGSLWPDRGVTETGIENIATQHKEDINNLLAGLKEYYHGEQSPDDVLRVLLSTNGNDYMERSITILQDVAPDGYKRVLRDLSGLAISSRALMVGEGYISEKKPKEEAPETNEDLKQLQSLASDEGVIIPIKVAGGIGYVKSGKIVLSETGELDKASSDEEIYYVDDKGETQVIGINMLSIDKANPLFNQTPEAIIASATAPTETNINVGTSVTYRNAEGAERTSKVAGIDEAGSLALEDGALITPDMAEIVSHDYFYQDGESVVLDNDEVAIISRNGDGTYTASTATGKRVVTEGDIIGTTEEIDKQEAEAKATQEVVKETPQQEQAPQETPAEEINYEELAVTDPMRFVAEYDKVFGEGAGMSALEDTLASLEEQVESMRSTLSSRGISLNDKVKTKKELDRVYEKINVITSALPSSEKPLEVEESPKEEVEVEPEKKGIDVIRDKWTSAPKSMGVKDEIVLPNGDKLEGRYVMTEAGVATPSHNPYNNFSMSEGFPVTEQGTTINDRDYANDKAAQAIVEKRSASYDQRAVINPVVVSQDGVVYSGNDRTMAGELAAKNGTDDAYIEYIRKYGDKYGFPSEEVAKYEHPRVLFVPDEVLPYTTEVFGKFNAKETKSQNKTERAIKIGKSMQESTVNKITNILGNYEKMQDYFSNDREVREVINILVGDGMLGENEVAELYDNDRLSMVGKDYLETIFIGMALPEKSVRMSTEYPSIRQALLSAITVLADNRRLPNGYALTEELEQAITTLYRARKGGVKQGEGIGDYLKQAELFSGVVPLTGLVANEMAFKLNSKSKTAFRDFIDAYNKEAREASQGQVSIFSGKPLTRQDIMQALITASPRFQITPSVGVYGVELTGHPESIFESNAMLALNGIKQNKATGAQWLAMLQKAGGIKAGEDKWIGLSDYLAENKERSLTRDEVAEYVANNGIRLEEVRYSEVGSELMDALAPYQNEFEELMGEGKEVIGSMAEADLADYAFQKMVKKYGDDFELGFEWNNYNVHPQLSVSVDLYDNPSESALIFLNLTSLSQPINSTRLRFTTEGLSNKKELAFVVPTIVSWNQNDNVHFGDAGEGRSVGWVRFGDANIIDGDNHQRSVLMIDEIQSQRHQEAREKGYLTEEEKRYKELESKLFSLRKQIDAINKDIEESKIMMVATPLMISKIRSINLTFKIYFGLDTTKIDLSDKLTQEDIDTYEYEIARNIRYINNHIEYYPGLQGEINHTKRLIEEYKDAKGELLTREEYENRVASLKNERALLATEYNELKESEEWQSLKDTIVGDGVPMAPFEKNWSELALKRMLRYAAENGYEYLAWTTGAQQGKRYGLQRVVDSIIVTKEADNVYRVEGLKDGGVTYVDSGDAGKVATIVGKENALKWIATADEVFDISYQKNQQRDFLKRKAIEEGYSSITDSPYIDEYSNLYIEKMKAMWRTEHSVEEFAIGDNNGMHGFYDVMLPSFVNKYGKKWGVNVEDIAVPVGGGITVHSVKITEEMKNGVMKPQPLFQVPDNQLNLIAPRISHERISPLIDRLKETGLAKDVILVKDEAELSKYISIADGIKVTIRGRVAAATDSNGNIVIVENNMRLDTAFHEYCHKLWSYAKNEKKESVLRGLKKIADGAPEHIKEYVRKNYPTLGYEAYLDEVFAWHTASKSQGRLQQFLKERGLDKRTSSEQLQDYEWYRQMEEEVRDLFKGMVKEFIKSNPTPYGVTSATLSHIDELSVFDAYDEMSADELINAVYDVLMSGKRKQLKDDTPVEVMNQKGTESLIAVHNITSDKLKGALSLGGLANPSMAVYDTALSSHEGYGEISFILPSEKLEGVSTFSRDAWTPKFPRVEYSFSDKARAKCQEILKPIEDAKLKDAMGVYLGAYLNESGPTSSPLAPLFLQEKGIPFSPSQRQGKYRNQTHHLAERIFGGEVSKEAYDNLSKDQKDEFFLLINGKLRGVELERMSYVDAIKERINANKQRLSLIKDNPDTDQATINMVEKRLAENEALLELAYESDMTQVAMDMYQDKHSKRDIDAYGTFDKAEMIITEQGMLEEFRDWQDSVIDEIAPDKIFFSHWTPDGDRKYKPYTLDEVSKWMKKKGLNASDWGFQTGMEYFLSYLVKKMKSRSAIRKNRSMLVSYEVMREWSEKTQEIYHDAFWGVMNDGALPQKYSNDYIVAEQVAFEIMQDVIVKKRPISAVEKEYKVTLSDATRQAISDFNKEAQSAVDFYFETKFQRPVYFNEFALAVVPKDLAQSLKDKLKEQGLEVREYDPTVEGHRSEVIDEAVRNREDVLFQIIDENNILKLSSSNKSVTAFDKKYGTDVKGFLEFLRNGKKFEDGKPTSFHIATAGKLLSSYGIKGKFFVGKLTFSRTHTKDADHELGVKEWVDVINNINNPLAIVAYNNKPNSYRIYTYALINGKNICVGVNVLTTKENIELSNIITAFGREIRELAYGKESSNLIYPSINELKQTIEQVSTAPNPLLYAPSSASADKVTKENSNNQELDKKIRFRRAIGGNGGYVDYSMSRRAAEAREEGRFPKTDFKKEYGISDRTLSALVELGIINNSEWHHTSMYGNRTKFYGWDEPWYSEYYLNNKKEIDSFVKKMPFAPQINAYPSTQEGMDAFTRDYENYKKSLQSWEDAIKEKFESLEGEYNKRQELLKQEEEKRHNLFLEYGAWRTSQIDIPLEYRAANGVLVKTNGSKNFGDWEAYYGEKPAFKKYAYNAKHELLIKIENQKESLPTFEEWKENNMRFRTSEQLFKEPTEAQKKAGNYKMEHLRRGGYNISIENPKGSVRRGVDENGVAWENEMPYDYGYIRGTKGKDGDHIDIFLGPIENPLEVYVVDQVDPKTGKFDESKVMFGFESIEEARRAYEAAYDKDWKGLKSITATSKEVFDKWIDTIGKQGKPFAEYVIVEQNKTGDEVGPLDRYAAIAESISSKSGRKINIVRSLDEIKDEDPHEVEKKRRSMGYYDIRTGEITVVLPNIPDEGELRKTITHEALGHGDIRAMLGDKADAFFESVYRWMDKDARAKYKGYSHKEAAEEYVAEMAETYVQPTIWARIKAMFLSILRKIGLYHNMSDADIRYYLYKAAKYGKKRSRMEETKVKATEYELSRVVKGESRYRIVGEKGVNSIAGREELYITDNLALAKELHSRGVDDNTIIRSTGWERGIDGKWRYEKSDTDMRMNLDMMTENALRARIEVLNKQHQYDETISKGVDPISMEATEMAMEVDNLKAMYEEQYGIVPSLEEVSKKEITRAMLHMGVNLGELLKASKVMEEYPVLREYTLTVNDFLPESTSASTDTYTKNIMLSSALFNDYTPLEVERASALLMHEIQHVIQEEEGFISGGSTVGVAKLKHLLKEKIDIATGRELTAQGSLVNMLANKEVMERYLPVFDIVATENGFSDMEEMVDFLMEEDYDSYARLAGEVEARRVERRRWMTAEEIKQVDEVYREEISRAVAISTQGNLMSEDSRSYRRFHLISEVNRILASTDRVSQGVKRHLVVQYIKNYLTSRDMYNFSKGDLARIMTWVEKAPTKRDFNHALSALYFEVARLGYQQSLRKVRELKKKKLEGDKNGISQARKVDASTAEFFKLFIAKTAPSMRNLSDPSGALSKELYDDSRGEPTGIEVDLVSLSEALSNNPTPEIVMRHKDAVYKKAAIELAIRYEDALDIRDMIMSRHEEIQRAWADAKGIYTRYREQRNEYDAERYHAKMEWITQQRTALSEEMANLSDEMESIARELNLILQDGITTLQNELIARENERVENIKRALLSIGSKEYRGEATRWTDKINKLGVDVWHAIYMPIFNMANTLRFISGRRYPEGKSPMWRYYVEQGMKASENYYNRTTELARKIEDKSIEIFNLRYKDIQRRAQQTLLPVYIEDSAVEAINALSEGGREHHSNQNKKGDPVQLSVDAALYIIGLTRNPDIAARYEARGVTETEVANIKRALLEAENGDKYLALLDWIQYDLIPSTRGRYNATFRQLNGRNMAYVVNYLPLKIRKSDQTPKQDALAGNQATARSVEETGHIKSRQQTIAIPSLTMGILEYLPEYIQKMEEWDAYSLFGRSVNDILKSKEFRNRLEANMPGMYMILAGSFQVSTGAYTPAQELNNKIYKFLEKARSRVVGANIAYNMIPAIKQLLSYPSVFDSYNTLSFYKMMVKYSNPVDNIKWVMDGHLPLLKKRWEEGLAGFQELQYKGDGFLSGKILGVLRDLWVKKKGDLADWMLSGAEFLREKGGMLPNRAIDVFTCAMVARPVYEETYNRMVARGATETEAKKEAEFVATLTYNASQQSNERWLTSPMQSELGYGKMITTYQTTNIQQQALLQLALMELAKSSKEERENLYTKYYNDYREKGYSDEVAKKKASSDAKQDLREIKRKATINVFLYSYMMKWLWSLGGVMFSFILKGEDEEKYVDKALTPWQSLIDGAGQGSAWWIPLELAMGAWQARQEVEIRPDMLADFVNDNLKEFKDEENDWEDRAFVALNLMHTYDTGLDLRKLRNMFLSLSNMPKVLKYEKGGRDLILQMLNLSPSQRKRILMQKLEGETYEDYRERVSDMSEILYMIDIKEDAIRTKFIEKMMEEIAEDRGELDEYVGTKMYVEQTLKDKGISKSGSFNLKDKKEEMEKERENRELINRLKRNQGNMRKMTAKVDNLGKDAYESIYESYYDNLRSIAKLLEVMDD